MRTLTAADFSANYTAILADLREQCEAITLTAGGEPVALLTPIAAKRAGSILGFYKGKLEIIGDITASLYSDEELVEFEQASLAQLNDPA